MKNQSRDIELEQRIDAYVKGQLSDNEAEQLWVELIQKPEYISLLKTEVDLARARAHAAAAPSSGRYYWKWAAAAAAAILLVLAINIWDTNEPAPLKTWTETEVNLMESLASAEVTRSADAQLSTADSLLNAGYRAALSGDTEQASQLFASITEQYDTTRAASKARLNLGILQYHAKKYDDCIKSFNDAIAGAGDDSLLTERSHWYIANAFVHTDSLEGAREAVEKAYKSGNLYKKQSTRLRARLDYEMGNITIDEFEKQVRGSQ